MALTHTQTKERAELIALSIGEIQLDRELLSDMIWGKLGSNASLPFLSGAPEAELILRLLVDGEVAKIREYTESDIDETCLLAHIQIRPHAQHLSWRPIVTFVKSVGDVFATAQDTGSWRHVPCTLDGDYTSTLVDVLSTIVDVLLTDDGLKEFEDALLAEFRAKALELLATEVF